MYVEDQIDGKPIQVKRYKISRQAAALRARGIQIGGAMKKLKANRLREVGMVSVICCRVLEGDGTTENPAREVYKFYLPSGKEIGEVDANYFAVMAKASAEAFSARIR